MSDTRILPIAGRPRKPAPHRTFLGSLAFLIAWRRS